MNEESIFLDAVQKQTPEARAAFLDEACADNAELRHSVELLLKAHDQAGHFLQGVPQNGPTIDPPNRESPGTVIGPYKLLQQIGEGGMGTVFMAEQTQPVQRKVALKVIKPGMDSRQVIARFEAERQALAMMDHVNIARVFDGGETPPAYAGGSPRPYFVMELVHGVPITKYCDDNHLTPRQRLELFVPVCQAIQHAHQKGIIHRDIKPSNVMITLYDGKPVPKVIDFGVAKATEQKLTERTLFTQYGTMVGTLEYMSPEQAETSALGVDTRSDIYSLGVLLYELLTGSTPLSRKRLKEAAYAEILRMIKEEEPPKPSTRLSDSGEALATISAQRHMEPAKLTKLVRGELDWIVMKTLEKDRNRRYETANGFARDLQRYLADEPVLACPPSLWYRTGKLLRRHRMFVASAVFGLGAAVLIALFSLAAYTQKLRNRELQVEADAAETQRTREAWARQIAAPEIARLMAAGSPVVAYRLLREAQPLLPTDPALAELDGQLLATTTIESQPSGAEVFIQDWREPEGDWLAVGRTPLENVCLPRDRLRWKITKEGYASRQLVALASELPSATIELALSQDVPPDMVYIPAAAAASRRPALGRFLIDRYEVTNQEFQRFVDAGGYTSRRYWKQAIVESGKELAWEAAMRKFVDQSGSPGPALWTGSRFPPGEERFPVQGLSWYEATAYAEFAGKSLPTIHHWERTAGLPQTDGTGQIVSLSNFSPRPVAVGTNRGIGPFEVYDLAGNVREWCANASGEGRMATRGGAYGEPNYQFYQPDAQDALSRSPGNGLRCVRYLDPLDPSLLEVAPEPQRDFARETPTTPEEIQAYRRLFAYDHTAPLDDKVVSAKDESVDLRHEIVRVNAAYGNERFAIHLLLPRRASVPHPTLVYWPGSGVRDYQDFDKIRPNPDWALAVELVRRGWAVCWPTMLGSFERMGPRPPLNSLEWRDRTIRVVKDMSRSVDYLETRRDIDSRRLGFLGFSWGANHAALMLAMESRLQIGLVLCGGHDTQPDLREIDSYSYVTHLRLPVLMIKGKHDESDPHLVDAMFFQHLGSSDKKWIEMGSGHHLPWHEAGEQMHQWLEPRLGRKAPAPRGPIPATNPRP